MKNSISHQDVLSHLEKDGGWRSKRGTHSIVKGDSIRDILVEAEELSKSEQELLEALDDGAWYFHTSGEAPSLLDFEDKEDLAMIVYHLLDD